MAAVAVVAPSPQDRDLASPGGPERPQSRADGEISRCGASAEPIFIQPGDVSARLGASRGLLSMGSRASQGPSGRRGGVGDEHGFVIGRGGQDGFGQRLLPPLPTPPESPPHPVSL